MTYYIVGKRAASIDSLIDVLSKELDINVQLKHIEPYMITDERDGKIIFINAPFAFAWDWYITAGFTLEKAGNMFCDEIMLFKGFNKYDYCIDYTDFKDVVEKVKKIIVEDTSETPV